MHHSYSYMYMTVMYNNTLYTSIHQCTLNTPAHTWAEVRALQPRPCSHHCHHYSQANMHIAADVISRVLGLRFARVFELFDLKPYTVRFARVFDLLDLHDLSESLALAHELSSSHSSSALQLFRYCRYIYSRSFFLLSSNKRTFLPHTCTLQ